MEINFEKYSDRLVPAIVQDVQTGKVLMLAFMNAEALEITQTAGKVTFYSRSKQRLWTKGETSGNFLESKEVLFDCDSDTILVKASPVGPVCHTGADTCFAERNEFTDFLFELEEIIKDRKRNPKEGSYTASLYKKGLNKIAQKVGEEAVELVIEATGSNDDRFIEEAGDLLYHFLVLCVEKNIDLDRVYDVLKRRRPRSE
jgi:phosphoribosyl-ATP pyrophosphohydrolase/phosphoribosyl-AMP cyclohydrolase